MRVQGLNRLKIPGSFSVHLQKHGKTIASKAFFQPNEAGKCENCVENAVVHFDFELPQEEVIGGKLSVAGALILFLVRRYAPETPWALNSAILLIVGGSA